MNTLKLFLTFLYLGCTSFGGPVAHLGYFRQAFVSQRGWLSEQQYADLVALCQFMPGPASSQVGLGIGLMRGGYAGALAAWLGFTLPSAAVLIAFALGLEHWHGEALNGVIHGLKIVAVAVVAHAVWGMANQFCRSLNTQIMMVASCVGVLLLPGIAAQVAIMLLAAWVGWLTLKPEPSAKASGLQTPISRQAGILWLVLFAGLLLVLPMLASSTHTGLWALVDAFYRTGALVFGGGHVVLPILQAQTVPLWVDEHTFLAGYGAAQAVPGPLFTFAAFLGTAAQPQNGLLWGILALLAVFLPSFLLLFGLLPFWSALSQKPQARAALSGINAAVVGLLLAALYQPVWVSAIHAPADFALAVLALCALMFWRLPVWLVVMMTALCGLWLH